MIGDESLLHMLRQEYMYCTDKTARLGFLCLCVGSLYLNDAITRRERVRLYQILRENAPEHIPNYSENIQWWPAKERQKRLDWIDSMIEKYK